ncbi:MAG: ATP-binding protein [Burkholderiaceae bacterium]
MRALRRHSIRGTLLLWLATGLALALSLVACMLYLQAREEANALFDYQMQQVASAMPSRFLAGPAPGAAGPFQAEANLVIQIWDPTGVRIYFSHEDTDLPQRAVLGFSTIEVRGQDWRVYSAQQGPTVVQIAQPLRVRSAIAARSALNTVAPLLVLIPFLGSLIWVAVGRGLAPVHGVATQLAARDAGLLTPIQDTDLPTEIHPLTHAVNALLLRLEQAAAAQRVFVADAAHELRTPLAALKLQVGVAERAADGAARDTAFKALHAGLDRASRLVQQLLTLARHEPGAAHPRQPVDLAGVTRDAVVEMAVLAQERGVDLGLVSSDAAIVSGDAEALRILINNLIDNALKATPAGGTIDVAVGRRDQHASVDVTDSGPGIAPADLSRVFDRFYRSAGAPAGGSGLGLAIVRRIADRHQGEVELRNTGHGLRATFRMPALPTDESAGAPARP